MNEEKIALIVNTDGSFEVRKINNGSQYQLSWSMSLEDCLRIAASNVGQPLLLPMVGP